MLSIKDEHYLRVSALQCATQLIVVRPSFSVDREAVLDLAKDFLEFLKKGDEDEPEE